MRINKVAVIGSNSFSGSHFVNHILNKTNWKVIGISRSPEPSKIFLPYRYQKNPAQRFSFYKLDVNPNFDKITKLLDKEKTDIIVNFAAQSNVPFSWEWPDDWFRTNCLAIVKLANHLKDAKYLKKYIQISTPEVYGSCNNQKEALTYFNPTTPYAASKAAGDQYLLVLLKNFNFPVSFVRSANVYGPHQQLYRIIPSAIITLKRGDVFALRTPSIKRNFVHIEDVSNGIRKIILKERPGGVYHFSSGQNISMQELAELICKKLDLDPKKSLQLGKQSEIRDNIYKLNCVQTQKRLDWQPAISLSQGIDETIKWAVENWEELKNLPLDYIHKK